MEFGNKNNQNGDMKFDLMQFINNAAAMFEAKRIIGELSKSQEEFDAYMKRIQFAFDNPTKVPVDPEMFRPEK